MFLAGKKAARENKTNSATSVCSSERRWHETMDINKLSSEIIKAAINVHRELGPGLLESVYQACMVIELKSRNRKVQSEVPVPVK